MILKYSVHPRPAVEEALLRRPREVLGLPDLRMWRDYYIEVDGEVLEGAAQRLAEALADPLTEDVHRDIPLEHGSQVQVAYKRGIIDNENDSLVTLAGVLGIEAAHAKVATTYASHDPDLSRRVAASFVNPSIEELHVEEPEYDTLGPLGHWEAPETYDLASMSDDELAAVGVAGGRNLTVEQMKLIRRVQEELSLPYVTDVLVEAMDARWSDHCLHTTWKSLGDLLRKLIDASTRAENPNVVSMFGDNAGVWDFYDGWAIAIKGETHSGPSAVSAYFGQLTKLGGVLRDILGTGLGADPIGCFEYTATGLPESGSPVPNRPPPKQIAHETIRAIKEYGNTFGVPMMWSKMTFHPAYRAKPFALGGSIGLIPKEVAQRGEPQPGDLVMLIGGLTGNDGIHGASASSAGSEMDQASVQIGSPLEEVKFRQAIVELRDAGCLRALTDVGGAGLNSAVGEIGDPGGVWLNTALVPLKTAGLPTWRILLSESQERMLLALPVERLGEARAILARHAVRNTVIGRFTADGRYTVVHAPDMDEDAVAGADAAALPDDGGTGFSAPYELLEYRPEPREAPPWPQRPVSEPHWPEVDDPGAALARVLGDPEVSSQRFASSQYDTTVQGQTCYGPGVGELHVPTSYWAGTPRLGSPAAAVFSTAFNPWLFEHDPALAARQMFLSVLGTQAVAGVRFGDVCLCDNFYTPHLEPDSDAWLVAMVEELVELVDVFGTPLISGKDSSAGSVVTPEGVVSVPPAVFLSALGKVPDVRTLRRNEWCAEGSALVLIGPRTPSTAGTVAERVLGASGGAVDAVDARAFREYLDALGSLEGGTILSARPVGSGGLLATAALSALASGRGAELYDRADWFAEHRCGAIAEVPEDAVDRLPAALGAERIGRVAGEGASLRLGGTELLTEAAVRAWTESFEGRLR